MPPKKSKCQGCPSILSPKAIAEKRTFCVSCIEKNTCPTCKIICKENDMAIDCEMCHSWFHTMCVDMPPETYQLLKNASVLKCGIRYFCPSCDPKAMDIVKTYATMKVRQATFEAELNAMKTQLNEMKDFKDATLAQKVKNAAREESFDVSARKEKAFNIVISSLPEIDTKSNEEETTKAEMMLNECTSDLDIFQALVHQVGLDPDDYEVEECKRIPERRREDGPPRYLLVKMKDLTKERILLEKSGKIFRKRSQGGPMSQPFRNVYINHDLTKEERARQYDLRQEKRRRIEAGEQNLII